MSLKQAIVKNPVLVVAVAVIAISLAYLVWPASPPKSRAVASSKSFYTTDDGATWFPDSGDKIPPFEHDGKQAVRCYIFSCDGGKTQFAGYLERYTREGKARAEAMKNPTSQPAAPPEPAMLSDRDAHDVEFKEPQKGEWVNQSDFAKVQPITQVHCRDGSVNIEPVFP